MPHSGAVLAHHPFEVYLHITLLGARKERGARASPCQAPSHGHCHIPLPPPCSSGSPSKHMLNNHTERGCPVPGISSGLEQSSSRAAVPRCSGTLPLGIYTHRGLGRCIAVLARSLLSNSEPTNRAEQTRRISSELS